MAEAAAIDQAPQHARTIEDVQREYELTAMRLGHIAYQLEQLPSDAATLRRRMVELNHEMQALKVGQP